MKRGDYLCPDPDPDETRAILKMPTPTNLRYAVGIVNCMPKGFREAKQLPNSEMLLAHFGLSFSMILAADASGHRISADIAHLFPEGSDHTYLSYSNPGREELEIN
ncbi:hypothetical protein ACTXT7_010588 [Hymenolepis weldensis]